MKAKREHRFPLCSRALAILDATRTLSDGKRLVFPMRGGRSREVDSHVDSPEDAAVP